MGKTMLIGATSLVVLVCVAAFCGCSGCTENTSGGPDAGDAATSDTDTDADTDADTDGDSDTFVDTDTATVSTNGPWEWEDLPEQIEDCGEGCTQLSFCDVVQRWEWDVWGDHLVYIPDDTHTVIVVNLVELRQLRLPDVHEYCPIEPDHDAAAFHAAIFEDKVFYALRCFVSNPQRLELIQAKPFQETQFILSEIFKPPDKDLKDVQWIDAYGDRVVSTGGCGDPDENELCAFVPPFPNEGQVLIDEHQYGSYNSIWGNVTVWSDARDAWDHILGYDFSTEEFIEVAVDAEYQFWPRMQGTRVVWMDLRLGESAPWDNWANCAVFLKDLATDDDPVHVAGGDWIAAQPDVHGDVVVWADFRECGDPNDKNSFDGIEIWGRNLVTDQEAQITQFTGMYKGNPRIWGDRVFVEMDWDGGAKYGIFMFELPDELL